MQKVTLPFRNGNQEQETHRGVLISRRLKEMGLMMGKDYTWLVDANQRELVFMFNGDAEAWATLLTMTEL